MDSLTDLFGGRKDDTGRLIFGDPDKGCRHCGFVDVKYSRDASGEDTGQAAIYHPGTECCSPAMTDQISWRHAEVNQLKRKLEEDERRVELLREAVDFAESATKRDMARGLAAKAERGFALKRKEHYEPKIKELAVEIARLKRKRDGR